MNETDHQGLKQHKPGVIGTNTTLFENMHGDLSLIKYFSYHPNAKSRARKAASFCCGAPE